MAKKLVVEDESEVEELQDEIFRLRQSLELANRVIKALLDRIENMEE